MVNTPVYNTVPVPPLIDQNLRVRVWSNAETSAHSTRTVDPDKVTVADAASSAVSATLACQCATAPIVPALNVTSYRTVSLSVELLNAGVDTTHEPSDCLTLVTGGTLELTVGTM